MKKNLSRQPAVFLDRDGTLIEEVNYLARVEDVRVFSFVPGALQRLKDNGFLVIVVTNQSGIGRGIYNEANMHSVHEHMQAELADAIDGFYFCPHQPSDGCLCRKPGLGMIEAAQRDFDIDMENSWMVGDKNIDVETGKAANMQSILVLTGYGRRHQLTLEDTRVVIAEDLGEATLAIVASRPGI